MYKNFLILTGSIWLICGCLFDEQDKALPAAPRSSSSAQAAAYSSSRGTNNPASWTPGPAQTYSEVYSVRIPGHTDQPADKQYSKTVCGSVKLPPGEKPAGDSYTLHYNYEGSAAKYIDQPFYGMDLDYLTALDLYFVHVCNFYRLGYQEKPAFYDLDNIKINYNKESGIINFKFDIVYTKNFYRDIYIRVVANWE